MHECGLHPLRTSITHLSSKVLLDKFQRVVQSIHSCELHFNAIMNGGHYELRMSYTVAYK